MGGSPGSIRRSECGGSECGERAADTLSCQSVVGRRVGGPYAFPPVLLSLSASSGWGRSGVEGMLGAKAPRAAGGRRPRTSVRGWDGGARGRVAETSGVEDERGAIAVCGGLRESAGRPSDLALASAAPCGSRW